MNGHGKEALKYFEQMCTEGVQPDDTTFICVLSACLHAGLIDEGMHCYTSMVTDYMICAKLDHYTCMVDLFGHAGHLQGREYGHGNALETTCGCMDDFTWRLQNSW
jgi:pentatricopeptide repeat protein